MFKDVLVIGISDSDLISFSSALLVIFSCYLLANAPASLMQAGLSKPHVLPLQASQRRVEIWNTNQVSGDAQSTSDIYEHWSLLNGSFPI